MDELLTIEEVADRLRTSPRFVRRLIAERRIAFTKVGKFVRIFASDVVEAFLAAGAVKPGTSYVRPSLTFGTAPSANQRR
jgi:excisionase family DNA binding protein